MTDVQPAPGWRPIAEAPRDGTPIVGWSSGLGERQTRWMIATTAAVRSGFVWLGERDSLVLWYPSHWLPRRPAPPEPADAR